MGYNRIGDSMKNKGFTLIELIATIVILGIIMLIAIPNIIGIVERNKRTAYVEDARRLVTLAETRFRADTSISLASGQCMVMTLNFLENGQLQEPPDGGVYLRDNSFVVIRRNGATISYYVTLVEELPSGNFNGVGPDLVSSERLRSSDAIALGDNAIVRNNFEPRTPTANGICNPVQIKN